MAKVEVNTNTSIIEVGEGRIRVVAPTGAFKIPFYRLNSAVFDDNHGFLTIRTADMTITLHSGEKLGFLRKQLAEAVVDIHNELRSYYSQHYYQEELDDKIIFTDAGKLATVLNRFEITLK